MDADTEESSVMSSLLAVLSGIVRGGAALDADSAATRLAKVPLAMRAQAAREVIVSAPEMSVEQRHERVLVAVCGVEDADGE